jgi:hypothetical protein
VAKSQSTLCTFGRGNDANMPILTGKRGKAALFCPTGCGLGDDAAVVETSGWGEGIVSRAADQRGILSR